MVTPRIPRLLYLAAAWPRPRERPCDAASHNPSCIRRVVYIYSTARRRIIQERTDFKRWASLLIRRYCWVSDLRVIVVYYSMKLKLVHVVCLLVEMRLIWVKIYLNGRDQRNILRVLRHSSQVRNIDFMTVFKFAKKKKTTQAHLLIYCARRDDREREREREGRQNV